MAKLEIPDGIKVLTPAPLDGWAGPYIGDTEEEAKGVALQSIPEGARYVTMEAKLIVAGEGRIFWFASGVEDSDFQENTGGEGSQGPQGETGATGAPGVPGKQVEINVTEEGIIQQRYVGDSTWNDIISIFDLPDFVETNQNAAAAFSWGNHALAGYALNSSLSLYATDSALTSGLATKEPIIAEGLITQYFRGDKQWVVLNSASVGLGNVNNTSDLDKPISAATQAALDLKATDSNTVHLSGSEVVTGAKTFNGAVIFGNTFLPDADGTRSIGGAALRVGLYTTSIHKGSAGVSLNFDVTGSGDVFARFHPTTHELILQTPGSPGANTGERLQVMGASKLAGNVTVHGNLSPEANGTRDLGTTSIRFANVWSAAFINSASVYYGTTNQAGNIQFRFGAINQLVGGFQATTGEAFFQAFGATPTAVPSSQLSVHSTTKGVLLPRMTTAQKNAIVSPAEGLEVYDLDLHAKCFFNGTVWKTVATL